MYIDKSYDFGLPERGVTWKSIRCKWKERNIEDPIYQKMKAAYSTDWHNAIRDWRNYGHRAFPGLLVVRRYHDGVPESRFMSATAVPIPKTQDIMFIDKQMSCHLNSMGSFVDSLVKMVDARWSNQSESDQVEP